MGENRELCKESESRRTLTNGTLGALETLLQDAAPVSSCELLHSSDKEPSVRSVGTLEKLDDMAVERRVSIASIEGGCNSDSSNLTSSLEMKATTLLQSRLLRHYSKNSLLVHPPRPLCYYPGPASHQHPRFAMHHLELC